MSGPDFLDTNVLVYAYQATNRKKQVAARALLRKAIAGGTFVSSQALAELVTTLLHKLKPAAKPTEVLQILAALSPIALVCQDQAMVQRAVEAHGTYGIHFFDGMIVAAAERAGCTRIWSEDLNADQKYFGITVQNPFA